MPDFHHGLLGRTAHFADKLNSGLVKSVDWPFVRNRRSQTIEPDGKARFCLID
jgi:hypothetical protein